VEAAAARVVVAAAKAAREETGASVEIAAVIADGRIAAEWIRPLRSTLKN
jgi:hypothetical protein